MHDCPDFRSVQIGSSDGGACHMMCGNKAVLTLGGAAHNALLAVRLHEMKQVDEYVRAI